MERKKLYKREQNMTKSVLQPYKWAWVERETAQLCDRLNSTLMVPVSTLSFQMGYSDLRVFYFASVPA